MFEATFMENQRWIDSILSFLESAILIDDQSVFITADKSNMRFYSIGEDDESLMLDLRSDIFEKYKCDEEYLIGLDPKEMYSILKTVDWGTVIFSDHAASQMLVSINNDGDVTPHTLANTGQRSEFLQAFKNINAQGRGGESVSMSYLFPTVSLFVRACNVPFRDQGIRIMIAEKELMLSCEPSASGVARMILPVEKCVGEQRGALVDLRKLTRIMMADRVGTSLIVIVYDDCTMFFTGTPKHEVVLRGIVPNIKIETLDEALRNG